MENNSFFSTLGLGLLVIGFLICLFGFSHAINATWGMSTAFQGFAEMLFGMSFLFLGNGLIKFGK